MKGEALRTPYSCFAKGETLAAYAIVMITVLIDIIMAVLFPFDGAMGLASRRLAASCSIRSCILLG